MKIRKISNDQTRTKEQTESNRVSQPEALDVMRTFTDLNSDGFGFLQIHSRKSGPRSHKAKIL